ncbi:hypothetical protein O0L34_g19235 [Tuta absoluta]|nr:hypothetical protein O0L34_g19235 [Tuta absoluta]
MFTRTPVKPADTKEKQKSPPKTQTLSTNVRLSIDKLEAGGSGAQSLTPATGNMDNKTLPRQILPKSRISEARATLERAKSNLNNSGNIRKDLKANVLEAIDRLYQLVKDAEVELSALKGNKDIPPIAPVKESEKANKDDTKIMEKLEEHTKLLKENALKMDQLQGAIERQKEQLLGKITYAGVLAGTDDSYASKLNKKAAPTATPVHSIIISSENEADSSSEVLNKLRSAIDAKTTGIRVDKLRKAKDQKVIIGCHTKADLARVTERIKTSSAELKVDNTMNKDPLIVVMNVLNYN